MHPKRLKYLQDKLTCFLKQECRGREYIDITEVQLAIIELSKCGEGRNFIFALPKKSFLFAIPCPGNDETERGYKEALRAIFPGIETGRREEAVGRIRTMIDEWVETAKNGQLDVLKSGVRMKATVQAWCSPELLSKVIVEAAKAEREDAIRHLVDTLEEIRPCCEYNSLVIMWAFIKANPDERNVIARSIPNRNMEFVLSKTCKDLNGPALRAILTTEEAQFTNVFLRSIYKWSVENTNLPFAGVWRDLEPFLSSREIPLLPRENPPQPSLTPAAAPLEVPTMELERRGKRPDLADSSLFPEASLQGERKKGRPGTPTPETTVSRGLASIFAVPIGQPF